MNVTPWRFYVGFGLIGLTLIASVLALGIMLWRAFGWWSLLWMVLCCAPLIGVALLNSVPREQYPGWWRKREQEDIDRLLGASNKY